jgi:hypothetical protein
MSAQFPDSTLGWASAGQSVPSTPDCSSQAHTTQLGVGKVDMTSHGQMAKAAKMLAKAAAKAAVWLLARSRHKCKACNCKLHRTGLAFNWAFNRYHKQLSDSNLSW